MHAVQGLCRLRAAGPLRLLASPTLSHALSAAAGPPGVRRVPEHVPLCVGRRLRRRRAGERVFDVLAVRRLRRLRPQATGELRGRQAVPAPTTAPDRVGGSPPAPQTAPVAGPSGQRHLCERLRVRRGWRVR